MSNPDATQVFDSCDPLVDSGQSLEIRMRQTLVRPTSGNGQVDLLHLEGPDTVHLRVEGPQTELLASDIAGVYPTPGSDDSPDEFLPHIALTRRTLPWERPGPQPGAPWLALLVVRSTEFGRRLAGAGHPVSSTQVGELQADFPTSYDRIRATGLGDGSAVDVVKISTSLLGDILALDDLRYLCHVRRAAKDNPLAKIDDDRDLAVVVAGRLPDAGSSASEAQLHHALLVSLEGRTDLVSPTGKTTALVVLHHWSFTPSKGGDFEQVIKAIRVRPYGGVLRFGNLPRSQDGEGPELSAGFEAVLDGSGYLSPPPELHQEEAPVEYRGPLRPFAPPPRSKGFAVRPAPEEFEGADPSDPPDYSHAAAFEIGRLATLAGEGLAADLHKIRFLPMIPEVEVPVLVDQLPDALRRPDWVVNPSWWSDPYTLPLAGDVLSFEPLLKTEAELLQSGQVDFTGIAGLSAPWKQTVLTRIEEMAGIEQQLPSLGEIEMGAVTGQELHEQFAEVVAVTRTI